MSEEKKNINPEELEDVAGGAFRNVDLEKGADFLREKGERMEADFAGARPEKIPGISPRMPR